MKKKVFLLLTFIVLALGILFSGSKPEVEAAESCENHTIYYLLLDATRLGTFKSAYNNPDIEYSFGLVYDTASSRWKYAATSKDFNYARPVDSKKISEGFVTLGDNGEMTFEKFYDYYNDCSDNVVSVDDDDPTIKFIRATMWIDPDSVVETGSRNITVSESDFSKYIPPNYGNPYLYGAGFTNDLEKGSAGITLARYWKSNETIENWKNMSDDTIIYSPAVYQVTYEVCEEVEDPVDTETVYVNFCELGDRVCSNLAAPIKLGEFEIGDDKPTYNCPDPLSNYPTSSRYTINVSDPENYKFDSDDGNDGGVIKEEKNNDIYCYYTKDEIVAPTEHTLTVKYGSTEGCSDTIAKTVTKPGLVSGDSVSVDAPSIITVSDAKMTYSQVGNVSPRSFSNYSVGNQKLTVTMPDSDVTICLVYTPKTGLSKGWLYLVWAIGLGSLGYSGWYFYRYYKNKKQEI